ncbi:gamma-glutamyl-gamma-aminobutyrate hydrolase family protein [Leucobacter chinensis]|uniref:gamma-glutamyl-gamma-aminobutyrate hydrolase family protein n=1 Tax=Leucobacter chinensis TaxID=2851010 RepID=UPI001C241814|nr:gamma-glutamyl-gamma-aminobutyrate hydrolase family protein [Leucobacter chinensis]
MTAPLIGITTWQRDIATHLGAGRPTHTVGVEYVDLVQRAGGIPVLLVPDTNVERILGRLDALVMTGGQDVHPSRYGAQADPEQEYSEARDEFEFALALAAREMRLPTLAICRGLQVANVAFGGTLIEDIEPTAWHERVVSTAEQLDRRHPVTLDATSALAAAYGVTEREINTIHHQSVGMPARGLRVTGMAPDGVVEAVESTDPEWQFWGVQWHPEKMQTKDEVAVEDRMLAAFVRTLTTGA